MAKDPTYIKDNTGAEIKKSLTNVELVKNAKERLVHEKDEDHETVPTTNHVQLMLDNIRKKGGTPSDLADELLASGYKKTIVRKIMDTIEMYHWPQ